MLVTFSPIFVVDTKITFGYNCSSFNNISESAMSNSKKPIKFTHLSKLANQSTLNVAHVIEITKTCTVAFIKARNSLVF